MSKKELIDAIAESADLTKDKAGVAVDAMIGYIEKTLKKLIAHGVTSLEKIVASPAAVLEVPGIGDKTAVKIVRSAREHLGLETAGEEEAEARDGEHEPMAAGPEEGGESDDGEEEALLVGEGASGVTDGADRGDGSDATGGER